MLIITPFIIYISVLCCYHIRKKKKYNTKYNENKNIICINVPKYKFYILSNITSVSNACVYYVLARLILTVKT